MTTSAAVPAVPSRPRAPRPAVLAAVFYGLTLLASGALVMLQPMSRVPEDVLELVQFGPALAVGVLAAASPEVRRLVRSGLSWGGGTSRAVAAASAALLIGFAGYLAIVALSGAGLAGPGGGVMRMLALVIPLQLLGALAEEVGWRGVLQPTLRRRLGMLPASTAVGLLWALWHVPTLLSGPVVAISFTVSCVAISVLLGVLTDGLERGRVWGAGVLHWLVNLVLLAAMSEVTPERMCALAAAFGLTALLALALRARVARRAERGSRPAAPGIRVR